MWLIGGLGFCGSLLAFILSFIPPSQISTGSNTVWFTVLIVGAIVVVIAPFIIYASKKPSWVDPNSNFEPFHWEEQAQVQSQAATATVTAATATATTAKAAPATSAATDAPAASSTSTNNVGNNAASKDNTPKT